MRNDPVYRRRRAIAGAAALAFLAGGGIAGASMWLGDDEAPAADERPQDGDAAQEPAGTAQPQPSESTEPAEATTKPDDADDAEAEADAKAEAEAEAEAEAKAQAEAEAEEAARERPPSDTTSMERVDYVQGGITPKSVVASGDGLVIANNMMYSHTSTVYDSESHELLETLSDAVDMAEFGVEGHPGESSGSPVEAAWTEDGRYAYVSQYTMYGESFGVEGFDACTPSSGVGNSFLYRFDAEDMTWDQVIEVGAVPKFVDITPDQKTVLVSNWCDSTISVVDREKGEEVEQIPIAAAPRGIEVLPDNRTAYVAAMYAGQLFKVDLETGESEVVLTTSKPRHLNLSPDGKFLYLAASGSDTIFKIDTATDEVVDQVVSGREPRSMALSPDGTALYVVNYYEPSMAKIGTEDMEVLQKEPTDATPIGITYDDATGKVWVASYAGSLAIFDDTVEGGGDGD